ncbi:Palmitoyltransferase AKR1 [Trichoplax sp. H2]|nr:Palmitoyltransferase AKR1 [Trichoplax sp. H2]|eukprot:RDD46494.1 Palmitoyltransferase AKR1 [Trichoplax sp. H2]
MSEKESIIVQGAENIVEAINCNRTDIVRALLRQAKSIEEKEGDVHIVKEILNYGYKNQETSLILATKLDRIDCVRALLSAGANPCISNDEGKTAYQLCNGDSMKQVYITEFFQATAQSNIVRIQQLLDCGIPVNSSDGVVTNCRPIHWAASFANKETVATLLENGADINVQDQDGSTPLHDAIKRNSTEIIGVLLKYGARTDIKATSGSYEGKTAAILLEENNELQNKLLESTAGDSPTPDDELDRKTESSVCVTPTAVASREHYAGEKLQQETTLRFSNSSTNDLSISDVCNGASLSIANNMTASSSDANSDTIHYQASASAKLSEQIPHTNDVDSINENISQFSTEISLNDVGLDPRLDILWPPPQQISQLPGLPYIIKKELRIKISRSDQALIQRIYDIWRNQRHRFESLGYTLQLSLYSEYDHDHADMHNVITCVVNDSLVDMPQRYRISIRRNKLLIMSSDLSGMWYAVSTFFQLLQLFPDRALPQLQINDWPDILNRAVIVDVAHGVTPKMESLLELVDLLSFLKYNQLQLYLPAASVLQADDLHAIPYSS